MEVIKLAQMKGSSQIVFSPKKDGTLCFCVSYREMNEVMIRDSYLIPQMDERITLLGDAKIFSTFDASSGYCQVEIVEWDCDKSAFTSHHGLSCFTKMPSRLKSSLVPFQRAMDVLLSKVKWQIGLVYLDDIVILSKTADKHIEHVRKVLTLLNNASVTPNLRKCELSTSHIDYLGHAIHERSVKVST